jgi:SM-20-related protein
MLDQILQGIERDGWAVVPGLLAEADLARLNQFVLEHREDFLPACVGAQGQRQRREEIRGDHTLWLDPDDPQEFLHPIFEHLNQLRDLINERFYLGLKDYECHLALYPPGSFYKKHLDRFEKNSSRRLSFIFYLNLSWEEEWGGELVLYHQEGQMMKRILPMPGTFVCFLSDEFPHEVLPATHERRSLTGWMHTKIIN